MNKQKDIQDLIPEDYRDLIEAVPKGFLSRAAYGALLFGALLGALAVYIAPAWMVSVVVIALLIGHYLFKRRCDMLYDKRIADLKALHLDWKTDEDQ